ncbi:two-component sensor histidine kinase [Streptomyces sp. WAC 05379]|uniref:sensor histidine kinase n=1 Tax=Streptomyces TaxID=1883 RepID=UPI000F73EDBC|nr:MULTISPECIES: sensor histidine kinase [unclassified Streptomyces]MBT1090878.1 sensor histidine kinase [Streptomyces sp. Tu102]RSN92316.1 two-component sensor histidine kinase [Streptomyces sp. WAC 05379]
MSGQRITRERFADATAAVVAGAITVLAAVADDRAGPVDWVLIAAGSLALAAHRTAPRAVLAITTACLLADVVHAGPASSLALPVVGAVHTAARTGHRGTAAAAAGVFLAGYVTVGSAASDVVREALLLAGWFLCAVVTGLADRNWQAYLRQTEQRALEAERTREEAALRRAGEERLRIARELHDSLTHSISIVKLQAGVAAHLARKRGEDVPPALLAIQEASGEAMRELRATLEVLRTDEPTGTPALLVERARAAGLAVDLTVTGDERPLAATVDRAMYRIVQEALTNAARHAGPAKVSVQLTYEEGDLTIRVEDDGTADPSRPPTAGIGLTGMRERVTALGGTLEAAPRAEGGFAIRARLPLGEAG